MNKKGGLGKGLGALFGETSELQDQNAVKATEAQGIKPQEKAEQEVNLADIYANPYQPRENFDTEKLAELASSIKEYGVVEPLIVRSKGKKYELVAGERRLRAAKLAGLKTVPVIIREYDNNKLMEIALIENIQRDNLNALEEAKGIRRLMTECKLTQEQVAEKIGRSRSAVTNLLRLLNMPEEIQGYINEGKLTLGQAKMLAGLPNQEQQCVIARLILENDWSARIVEEVVKMLKEGKLLKVVCEVYEKKERQPRKKKEESVNPEEVFYRDYEAKLVEALGTKVRVQPKITKKGLHKGGVIEIEYYSDDDLNRIYEVLQPPQKDETQPAMRRLNV